MRGAPQNGFAAAIRLIKARSSEFALRATSTLSLSKSFRFGENRSVKIGADSSNLFNNHTWQFLGTSVGTPGFGRFGGVVPGRAVQLHAQVIF